MVFENGKPLPASRDESEKELRRVYRKLKGVRCQISMKLRELKKEARQTTRITSDDEPEIIDGDESSEALNEEPLCEQEEKKERRLRVAQSEVKVLLDHKRKLRKRFQKLQDEVRGK